MGKRWAREELTEIGESVKVKISQTNLKDKDFIQPSNLASFESRHDFHY